MDPYEDFVEELRKDPRIRVEDEGDPLWTLHLDVPTGCRTTIRILDGRYDGWWTAVIRGADGDQIEEYSAEYSDDGPVHLADVRPDIYADLRGFIRLLGEIRAFRRTTTDLSICGVTVRDRDQLEWLHQGAWTRLDEVDF